jgi:16S rRNA (uracil1498-N3)-methyltransferase
LKLVLHHQAAVGLSQLPASTAHVTLLVGPEGGLSDVEVQHAIAAGFVSVRFGPRILRTETAGIAALAAIQARWGDLA